MAGLEIIDGHTHLLRSKEHGQELYSYFLNRSAASGHAAAPLAYATVEEAQALMRETGVVHTNFLMFTWSGRYYRHGQYTLPDEPKARAKADGELRERIVQRVIGNNEWAVGAVQQHKNISFFAGLDPVLMDERTMLREAEDKLRRGALGLKIVPVDLDIRGDDRRLWPLYDYCQAKGVALLTQVGARPGTQSRPAYFEDALRQHPKITLIFAHMGHNPVFGEGADAEVADLMSRYPNTYTDVSLRFPEVTHGHVTPAAMTAHLRKLGTERVFYGSNFPFAETAHPDARGTVQVLGFQATETRASLEVLKTLPLTSAERENIAAKNFRRVLRMKG